MIDFKKIKGKKRKKKKNILEKYFKK